MSSSSAEHALAAHRADGLSGLLRLIRVKRRDRLLLFGGRRGGFLLGLRFLAEVAQAALAGLLRGALVANPDGDALGHARRSARARPDRAGCCAAAVDLGRL